VFSTILAIESSSDRATVAVQRTVDPAGPPSDLHSHVQCHERFSVEANQHAENLLPLISELLASLTLTQRDIQAVSVGVGPGSFTGLRAGIALAVGLGLGLDVPVFGISSLLILAASLLSCPVGQAYGDKPELIGALLDARRGEYFFAAFTHDLTTAVAPCLLSAATLNQHIQMHVGQRSIWIAGQAAVESLDPTFRAPAECYADTSVLLPSARLAARLTGTPHATLDPLPQYLREPDVKVPQLPPNPLVAVD
jgi:tRNA threonylcarbamoyladenosine biosynthesis protein TsaB